MPERPALPCAGSEHALVRVSRELLAEMLEQDSPPVSLVGVDEQDDGTLDLVFRSVGRRVTPEGMAQAFHEAYEALAPGLGYATREASAVPWEQVPEANKALMIATVRNVLIEQKLVIG